MKYLSLLFLICFGCAVQIHAQSTSDSSGVEMTVGGDVLHAQLQLTTNVISERYCSDGRLRFMLRLNFTNVGQETVVLDRRSSVVPHYTVSSNSDDAARKKYEMKGDRLIALDHVGMSFTRTLDDSHFAILKTGESYKLDTEFSLPLYNDPDTAELSLRPGNHVLQIRVWTWYYPQISNIAGREHWRGKGYLWSDPITSLPMPFKVEKKHSIVDCPS